MRREHPGPFYYHGGEDGLKVGDTLEYVDDVVPFTTDRLYAKFQAGRVHYGTLYRVEPVGDITPGEVDSFDVYTAPALKVIAVQERAVKLNSTERRRLSRHWQEAATVRRNRDKAEAGRL